MCSNILADNLSMIILTGKGNGFVEIHTRFDDLPSLSSLSRWRKLKSFFTLAQIPKKCAKNYHELFFFRWMKPNYFRKQHSSSSFLLKLICKSKMAMEPQQASPMSDMDGARLPSTPWPFWTCISTSGK